VEKIGFWGEVTMVILVILLVFNLFLVSLKPGWWPFHCKGFRDFGVLHCTLHLLHYPALPFGLLYFMTLQT